MIDWPLTIFEIWHYTVNTIGISFNALLIYMCIFKTPQAIRSYSVLMLNFAISDFGTCMTDLFTTYLTSNDDQAKIEARLRNRFPNYDFDNKTITGTLNILESWQAMVTILHMTLPVTPAYCAILILRKKIIRELASVAGTAKMSHATQTMHQQLLRALSLQACLPFFFSISVASYTIGQLGIYNSPALEYLTFSSALLIPAISPLISVYFVRPYRSTIILWYYRFLTTKMCSIIKPPTTVTHLFVGESGSKKLLFWNETEYQSVARKSHSQQSHHY
ncbi:hypothetical protein WR25_17018 [Diploscapter pachys]|uniref:G-protein coupled receptors family 1 profile domain-containing protein n=1 Tax=Diploscapter pachys TaxID=2018661 RepID=A0A2A2KEQ4_9BILA|nr:hypothetical protein WR25_17018 [Diploscapter pachys]